MDIEVSPSLEGQVQPIRTVTSMTMSDRIAELFRCSNPRPTIGSDARDQIVLLNAELQELPVFRRIMATFVLSSLIPFLLYFSDNAVVPMEKLVNPIDDPDIAASPIKEIWDNIRKYMTASSRVPWLYVIPSLPVVIGFSLQHLVARTFLENTLALRFWNVHYRQVSSSFADPRWIRDIALDLRPLFLSWFLLVPPAVLIMMGYRTLSSIHGVLVPGKNEKKLRSFECLCLKQQIDKKPTGREKEFFYSPWFTPVAMAPFLLGLPAALSYYIYWHAGIDPLFGFPSQNKQFIYIFPCICLYLTSLSWCLCALFFRSYFTFGLSYASCEYDIEIYSDVIKSLPIKGWFADFMSFRGGHAPCEILWKDVTSIKLTGAIEPLRLKTSNPILGAFVKIAESFESVAKKMDVHTDHLIISSDKRNIEIRLWELTAKEKVELFKSIREHAPSIYLDAPVQKVLIGSSVMREPQYTEIWFSVLQNHTVIAEAGDLQAGTRLKDGAYETERKIASGGQGVVYLARNRDGKNVVLKEFILTPGESLEVLIESAKDFENESKILGQLDHPLIVKLSDMFHEQGRVYLALEYVEGQSLRQTVESRGAMSDREVLELGEQMCEILEYLHAQSPPVVHRDFTPENLILQPDGKLKLIDFSVAQMRSRGVVSECAGKHAYTPPEQFRGDAVPQSDLYGCGATMFFLSTGADPEPITTSILAESGDERHNKLSRIVRSATALEVTHRCPSAEWLKTEILTAITSS